MLNDDDFDIFRPIFGDVCVGFEGELRLNSGWLVLVTIIDGEIDNDDGIIGDVAAMGDIVELNKHFELIIMVIDDVDDGIVLEFATKQDDDDLCCSWYVVLHVGIWCSSSTFKLSNNGDSDRLNEDRSLIFNHGKKS